MAETQHKYKYDKGENRPKHRGTVPVARIIRKWGEEVGGGTTWHGWPVQGSRIPDKIREQLEDRAAFLGERQRLNQWLRKRF